MKQGILLACLLCIANAVLAEDFFWINNGGNWTDYENHWATSSGGNTMHDRVPGENDNIFFDSNSFTESGHIVSVDTSRIVCQAMDWSNVTNEPEFISQAEDSLIIKAGLWLSPDMAFNYFGLVRFSHENTGQTLSFETAGSTINARIEIELPSGTLEVLSDLSMPQKQLLLKEGTLNMNNHTLVFRAFNADGANGILPTGPAALINADSIQSNQSVFFHDILDVSSLDSYMLILLQTADSSYVNFQNNTPLIDIEISGSKKCFLQGDLQTSGNINLNFNGIFSSEGHKISCQNFISDNPFTRTINLGTSELNTESFIVSGTTLNLLSSNTTLHFTNGTEYIYQTNNLHKSFAGVEIDGDATSIFKSGLNAGNMTIGSNTEMLIKDSKTININSLNCSSDCGSFVSIRGYCSDSPYEWPNENCMLQNPVIECNSPVTEEYLKLAFIKAQGATFTANNSYNQGNVEGWTINEPTSTDTYFWIGGKGEWSDPNHWSMSSGGTSQSCIPGKNNSVIFDANSFSENDTVFISAHAYCKDITWEDLSGTVVLDGNSDIYVQGNMTLHENVISDFSGTMYFGNNDSSAEDSIITNNVQLTCPVIFNGNGAYDFADSLFSRSDIQLISGDLSFSGAFASINRFISESDSSRNIDIDNATLLITGNNECWSLNGTNLNFSANSSEINLIATEGMQKFNGGNYAYDSLRIENPLCILTGSNQFGLLDLIPGNSLILETNSTTSIDSLNANGSCDQPISITTGNSNETAEILKTGYSQLEVSGVHLSNITADISGGAVYTANISTHNGTTSGWTFVATPVGQTYHWLGNNKNWTDLSNWENGGLPATCLPGIPDTIIIDESHMLAALTDTILIRNNQYCAVLDASGCNSLPVNFILGANLEVSKSILLDNGVSFEYTEALTPGNLFNKEHGLVIAPDGNNAEILSGNAGISVNLYCKAYQSTDSISLTDDLSLSDLAGIKFLSGNLITNGYNLTTDIFQTSGSLLKHLNIKNSLINIGFYAEFQSSAELSVNADSSHIILEENLYNSAIFNGGNQTYWDITLNMSENQGDIDDYQVSLIGSNHFRIFTVNPGGTVQFQGGSTQTIDSSMNIAGTCPDPIRFVSDHSGTQFTISKTNISRDTAYSLQVSDMIISPSAVAMLSTDNGNNSGWIFDPTEAAIASYNMPYPACVTSNLNFSNTSSSMWGGMDNLVFEWIIQDTDTTTTTDLAYNFTNQGEFIISLQATDTITGCYDIYTDTLELIKQSALISATPANMIICEGENLEFSANSNQAVEYEFYRNNSALGLGSTVTSYSASDFADGDQVFVETILDGCSQYSDTLTITVNPNPEISFVSDPSDAEICEGESITFTASGADLYRFYIDGNPVTSMNNDSTFTTSVINDLAIVSVEAQFSGSGCTAWNDTDITVRKYDNPVVNLVSDITPAIICEGEELGFTATGADNYEFFINGISQAPASGSNTFSSTGLNNGDLVTVLGSNTNGCNTLSSFVNVTVNQSPSLVLNSSDTDNEICSGEEITFSAEGAAEFLFFIDDIAQGSFSETETLSSNSFANGQTVNLAGRIGNCYDTLPTPLNITVHPDITLSADSEEICAGEEITFTANGDSQYEFFIDGISQGSASATNTLTSSELTNGQVVSVTGTAGACLPENIEVTVHDLPEPVLTCNDVDSSVCTGEEISFSASGALQYEFMINGSSYAPASVLNNLHTTLNDGDIVTLEAYNEFGCFAIAGEAIPVEVRPLPEVSLSTTGPTSLCTGDEVSLLSTGADLYEFFLNGNSLGEASTQNEITFDYLQNNDIITVEGTSNDCSDLAAESIQYTVFGIPVVNLEASTATSVCSGEEIALQASGANEYEFFLNGISQGTNGNNGIFSSTTLSDEDEITVVGYQNICSDTADNSIIVDVNDIPEVQLVTDIPTNGLCFGDTINCTVSGANEYQFFLNGVPVSELTSDNSIQIHHYFNGQEISVYGHNNSCVRETENPVIINLNRVHTTISTNTAGSASCEGAEITALAEGADIYEFFLDGISFGPASSDNSISFDLSSNGQTLWVAGTDSENGCTENSAQIALSIQTNPVISAYPETTFCENDSVLLQADPSGDDMIWLQNGNPIHEGTLSEIYIHEAGEYSVQLIRGEENAVFSAGNNASGQLGTGNTVQSEEMEQSLSDGMMQDIDAGNSFVLALDNNGQIHAWGNNAYGNIGNGTYSDVYTPEALSISQNVTGIAAGYFHSLVLLEDSTLLAWGKNDMGQLGYGNNAASNFPNAVINIVDIVDIDAGMNHSLALNADGQVYAWGNNEYGQLGTGDFENKNEATPISGLSNIVSITCGGNHSMAIDENGNLWVWGANQNGQLGLGDVNNRNTPVMIENFHEIVLMAGGQNHSMAYNSLGECYVWGSNAAGQLGIEGMSQSTIPVRITLSSISKLEAGNASSFAVRTDKSLWAWGQNNAAQLMLGHNDEAVVPQQSSQAFGIGMVAAGNEFTAVLWQDALQCESESITISMIDVPEVEIQKTDNILSVNQGIAWQWLLNGSEIPGANNAEYTVSAEGDYSVLIVFESGCSLETDAITIGSDIANFITESEIHISPNPARDFIVVNLDMDNNKRSHIRRWEIISTDTRPLLSSEERMQQETKIDISGLAPAVYYLRITSNKQIIIKKLVVQ